MATELAEKIIRQVEYYFGDVNMSKDKFMQEEIKKDSGWITLETLIKFNRLKALSTDIDEIINSLRESKSGLLEIDESGKKVRRAKPLPDNSSEFEITLKQNTVYVKGLPQTMLLDDLYAFFQKYGNILQIFMRRFPTTRQFKGSVFVTFEKHDDMKNFLELKDLSYNNDSPLIVESQEDYSKRKSEQLGEIQKKKEEKKNKKAEKESKVMESLKKGALIHIKGCNEECTRELLKEIFDDHAKIEWVYYNRGEPEATLRFSEENSAKDALDKALETHKGQIEVKGAKLECRVLEGEEESEFLKEKVIPQVEARLKFNNGNNNNNKRKRKGGKNFKGRGRKNKKQSDDDDDVDDDDENGASDEEKSPNKKVKA